MILIETAQPLGPAAGTGAKMARDQLINASERDLRSAREYTYSLANFRFFCTRKPEPAQRVPFDLKSM